MTSAWQVGIDIGGTFTDIVAVNPRENDLRLAKVLTNTADPLAGLVDGLRAVGLVWADVLDLVHGTTMVTNALVEERTAPVALLTTAGFEDVLVIGRQSRQNLYRLDVLPRLLPEVDEANCIGVAERVSANGEITLPLTEAGVVAALSRLLDRGVEVVAVSLLHSYANPVHETMLGQRLLERFRYVSLSHAVSPEAREYERTVTTVLNASVMPLAAGYVARLEAAIPAGTRVHLFHSASGMTTPAEVRERPLSLALSGPAAGAAAAATVCKSLGIARAISFDMGGTTTDVCLIVDGEVEISSNKRLAGRPIRQPMVSIESIGAGGGSIVKHDLGGVVIGPESAGSNPGPASYGRGGQRPTLTDANVLLGYFDVTKLLGGTIALDPLAAEASLQPIARALDMPVDKAALGVVKLANATMARALRRVTVERGIDARDCCLIAFGGMGPMHAFGLAHEVGIRHVLVPANSGGLSALGCVAAEHSYAHQRTVRLAQADWTRERFEAARADVLHTVLRPFRAAEHPSSAVRLREFAFVRYAGQSYAVQVPYEAPMEVDALNRGFRDLHEQLYGYSTDEPWIIESLRIQATIPKASAIEADGEPQSSLPPAMTVCGFEEGRIETPRYDRSSLLPGSVHSGPAIVADAWSTVVVPPGARFERDRHGHLHLYLEDQA